MSDASRRNYVDYLTFKEEHLSQYSQVSIDYFASLEQKENWIVKITIERLIVTFNKLPVVCQKPFDEYDANLIGQLIKLLAYLPLLESITALSFLGLENEDYGFTIYDIAYHASLDTPPCINSATIVDRVSIANRIALYQTIKGKKI